MDVPPTAPDTKEALEGSQPEPLSPRSQLRLALIGEINRAGMTDMTTGIPAMTRIEQGGRFFPDPQAAEMVTKAVRECRGDFNRTLNIIDAVFRTIEEIPFCPPALKYRIIRELFARAFIEYERELRQWEASSQIHRLFGEDMERETPQ